MYRAKHVAMQCHVIEEMCTNYMGVQSVCVQTAPGFRLATASNVFVIVENYVTKSSSLLMACNTQASNASFVATIGLQLLATIREGYHKHNAMQCDIIDELCGVSFKLKAL